MATISTSQTFECLSRTDKVCGIYKIINRINGKIYIGQSVDVYRRLKAHRNWKKRETSAIGRAILKHGTENFEYEIVEICDKEILNDKEKIWILGTNCISPIGYNLVTGGGSNFSFSDESKERMRIAQTGKKKSVESIEKYKKTMSKNGWPAPSQQHKNKLADLARERVWTTEARDKISIIKKQQVPWNRGKKLSKEHIEKTRLKKLGVPAVWRCRKITRNDGVIYNSIKEASLDINVERTSIMRVLNGSRKSIKGYTFNYYDGGVPSQL